MRFQAKVTARRLNFEPEHTSSNPDYDKKKSREKVRAILEANPSLRSALQKRMLCERGKTEIGWPGTPEYLSAVQLENMYVKVEGLKLLGAALTLVEIKTGLKLTRVIQK